MQGVEGIWRSGGQEKRRDVSMVDIDQLVPVEHLVRKIEKATDYGWINERVEPYYCHDNGRPGADPVILIKMVLLQHLFGIPLALTRAAAASFVIFV